MSNKVLETAQTINKQLRATTHWSVYFSWGVEQTAAVVYENMDSLALKVNGFLLKGWVIISYNEGMDLYDISFLKGKSFINPKKLVKKVEGIYFDQMGEIIDQNIERGTCSKEEYHKKIDKEYKMS